MGTLDHNVIATMMLSVLCFVVVVGIFLVYLVLRRQKHHRDLILTGALGNQTSDSETHFHLGLKRPGCWLAIKHRDVLAVQNALALHNSKPCSWQEGLSGEGEQKVFVSPPVSGWILVMGPALPDPSDDVDACFRLLMELSRRLGQVQFFSANGMLNQHAWVQSESGRILRGYAWAGQTLWNQGELTPAERDLKMKCYEYAEAVESSEFGAAKSGFDNSEKVHLLAARWSVDPDAIDEGLIERQWGIVGEPSRRF